MLQYQTNQVGDARPANKKLQDALYLYNANAEKKSISLTNIDIFELLGYVDLGLENRI